MIGWLAPGQGMERAGSGRTVAAAWPRAGSLLDLLEPGLHSTERVQPRLVAAALVAARALQDEAVPCDIVAGHSVGELAAWAIAGGASAEAVIGLARVRGRAMAAAAAKRPGGMRVFDVDDVPDPMPAGWGVAVHNPGQVVLSGPEPGPAGGRRVATGGAWHSAAMAPAQEAFALALDDVPPHALTIPLVSNHDGRLVTDDALVRAHLVAQLTSPARWTDVLATLCAAGMTDAVLLGPGHVLAQHLLRGCPDVRVHRTDRAVDVRATARALRRTGGGPR